MKKGTRDTILGLVFFGGLALLLWATQKVSDITFGERQMLVVQFENARGLRVGEPVFVLGTQLGKVSAVKIEEQSAKPGEASYVIRASLQLDTGVPLKKSSQIKVADASMLGGKRVDIVPGNTGEIADAGFVFRGDAPLGPIEKLGDMLGGDENKENLAAALKGIRDFMDTLNKGEGTIARLIKDDTLIKDAEAFVASLRKSAEELEKKQSLLGKIIYDDALGQRLDTIADNLESVTNKLNGTDGLAGRIINSKELADKFDKIIADVDKVTTNLSGTETAAGRFFNDKELGKKLDNIVASVEKATDAINDKDSGLIGALLFDDAMLADAKKIFKDIADVADKLNTGQGALARLINDPDMGRRLDSMIRQITRAVEDAREAAPIGTFFQVFSGAF